MIGLTERTGNITVISLPERTVGVTDTQSTEFADDAAGQLNFNADLKNRFDMVVAICQRCIIVAGIVLQNTVTLVIARIGIVSKWQDLIRAVW